MKAKTSLIGSEPLKNTWAIFVITVKGDRNHLEKEVQGSIYWKERKEEKKEGSYC